jgi:hypothetical protein
MLCSPRIGRAASIEFHVVQFMGCVGTIRATQVNITVT